ncbi:hypothetical protein HYH03_017921 [Edaphochlamys debaryana]|uniref:Uncharacterized protein n=1 Tax=Edaphochlamys debaryana TaxID=47281 RepID=A0A835XJ10_9CHLO|nr:hypothetical protein HYH03_017921 [Edaphochlamys debaryana]|eukprot:KAG2483186.1 hypothetical protein HYH03_017921 [Edaphochlamys debaryana]
MGKLSDLTAKMFGRNKDQAQPPTPEATTPKAQQESQQQAARRHRKTNSAPVEMELGVFTSDSKRQPLLVEDE